MIRNDRNRRRSSSSASYEEELRKLLEEEIENSSGGKQGDTGRKTGGTAEGHTRLYGDMPAEDKKDELLFPETSKGSYFTSGAYADGYQKGDFIRTVTGTYKDISERLLSGAAGLVEKPLDAVATMVGGVVNKIERTSAEGLQESIQGEREAVRRERNNIPIFEKDDPIERIPFFTEREKTDAKELVHLPSSEQSGRRVTPADTRMSDTIRELVAAEMIDEGKIAEMITNPPWVNLQRALEAKPGDDDFAEEFYGKPVYDSRGRLLFNADNSVLGDKSKALLESGGEMAVRRGLNAVPYVGPVLAKAATGLSVFGGEAEQAFRAGATYDEAITSAAISAAAEILTESLSGGIKFGGKTLDDALTKKISETISNKLLRALVQGGVNATGEGLEEVISDYAGAIGRKLTYMDEQELSELFTSEDALDAFIGGAIMTAPGTLGSIGRGTVETIKDAKAKKTEVSAPQLTAEERAVLDLEIKKRVEEAEKGGKKVSAKEKAEIEKNALSDMEKGYISVETIEKALGGAEDIPETARFYETFREADRRRASFTADLSAVEERLRPTYQRAIESGVLNNTNRTRELVELVARIEADKGIQFDFTNNQRLRESGFSVEGVTVNGYVQNGKITINIGSQKYLNTVVGHEITHVLEGSGHYKSLANTVIKLAKQKGEYEARVEEIRRKYKNVQDADLEAELVADLVGDYLFTDGDFAKNLSLQNRNVFQKIWDEIKYLAKTVLPGSKEGKQIAKIEKAFQKVYEDSVKVKGETIRYSIMNSKSLQENVNEIMTMSDEEAKRRKSEEGYISVAGHTPDVILDHVSDAKDIPIIIRFDAAYLATRHDGALEGNYHNYGYDFADRLMSVLEDPDAIVRLDNGRLNLLGTIETAKGNTSIVSVELNTVKDINDKYDAYNLIVSMLPAKDRYVSNIISKRATKIEYQKEDLSQVNPQLHKSLSIFNDKSSIDSIPHSEEKVKQNFSLSEEEIQNRRIYGDFKIAGEDVYLPTSTEAAQESGDLGDLPIREDIETKAPDNETATDPFFDAAVQIANERALKELRAEHDRLNAEALEALAAGDDATVQALTEQMAEIEKQISQIEAESKTGKRFAEAAEAVRKNGAPIKSSVYALNPYTEKQIKNWENSKRIVLYENDDQLRDFVEKALSREIQNKKMYFGTVTPELAKRIYDKTGINVGLTVIRN